MEENANKNRELLVEKIKIEENPKIRKYLKEFFLNPNKYFTVDFEDKQIIMGKNKTNLDKFKIPIPKQYQRRINRRLRTKTKTIGLINETLIKHLALLSDKKKSNKEIYDSTLKEGQKYIDDREIDYIFETFEKVQEINKTKTKEFVTQNELFGNIIFGNNKYDKIKNRNKKNEKTIKFEEKNENNNNNNNDKKSINNKNNISSSNKKKDKLIKSKSLLFKSVNNYLNNNQILNENKSNNNTFLKRPLLSSSYKLKNSYSQPEYHFNDKNKVIYNLKINQPRFASVFDDNIFNYVQDNNIENYFLKRQNSTIYQINSKSYIDNFIKSSEEFFKKKKEKEKIKKALLEKKKLMEKQSQFLSNTNQKLIKKEIAERLASQEKALMYNIKVKNKHSNILNSLSKKLKKQKSDLMLDQIEDYRLKKGIKIKINKLIKKTNPGQNYDWKLDLRNSKNEDKEELPKANIDDINYRNNRCTISHKDEITRNPFSKTFYSTNMKFKQQDKDYLKSKLSKTMYNKFMKDIKNIDNKYDGLIIEGQNLLKCERDILKKIKGKKIINNYDNILQEKDVNDKIFAKNFSIH